MLAVKELSIFNKNLFATCGKRFPVIFWDYMGDN